MAKKDEVLKAKIPKIDIKIPRIEFVHTKVTIAGETPLLCHAWSEKALRMIEDKQQKKVSIGEGGRAKAAKEARDPEAEFRAAAYYTTDGRYGFPARAIKCACVEAAPFMGLQKKYVRAGLFIVGDDILPLEFEGKEPRMRTDMVRLPSIGRPADVRYRPEFASWKMEVPVRVNIALLSMEQVINLLNWAGSAIGVGEWRTEKNGVHGQFITV